MTRPLDLPLVRSLLLLFGPFVLAGCPDPNMYATPRTVPAGGVAVSIAPEVVGLHGSSGSGSDVSFDYPTAPTVAVRVGLADQVDIGMRAVNLSSFGADLKYNFLRTKYFDMAVDPGAQVGDLPVTPNIFLSWFTIPMPIGINFDKHVSLVVTPGIMYGLFSVTDSDQNATAASGAIGTLGLGVDLRFARKFAMHPMVTAMRPFSESSGFVYMAGLGFNFGELPSFDDDAADAQER